MTRQPVARKPRLWVRVRLSDRRSLWALALLALACGLLVGGPQAALAYATVIPASGGEGLAPGATAFLAGPVIVEAVPGDIGVGEISLQAPTGFEFDAAQPVTVVAENAGNCVPEAPLPGSEAAAEQQYADEPLQDEPLQENRPLLLNGATYQTVVPTPEEITVAVTQVSAGGCTATVSWSGIGIRATGEAESGYLTKSFGGSYISGVADGATSFGTLSAVLPPVVPPVPPAQNDLEETTGLIESVPEETVPDETTAPSEPVTGETTVVEPDPQETTAPESEESTVPAEPEQTEPIPAESDSDEVTTAPAEPETEETTAPEEDGITLVSTGPEQDEATSSDEGSEAEKASTLMMTVESAEEVSFGSALSSSGEESTSRSVAKYPDDTDAYYVKNGSPSSYAAVVKVESAVPWTGSVSATGTGTAGMSVEDGSFRWSLGDMDSLAEARGGTPFTIAGDDSVFDSASHCSSGGSEQEADVCTYNFDYSLRVLPTDAPGTFGATVTYTVSPL